MAELNRSQVRQIFMEIAELPEAQREAAIARLCGGDAHVEAEVRRLLLADRAAEGFMASPTNPGLAALPNDRADVPPTASGHSAPISERPGNRIEPYKLLQVIGEGGFGSVFLAEQGEPVRRKVALKIIKLGMDTRQVIARFEAERQALAMMDHPHIARVLDAGSTESGRPYFVMEYVKGEAITRFAQAHKLSVRERLDLFAQVCAAVQHAHTKGIIHRDLKPGNVLVSMTDGRPFARVIDFGIAKATGASLTDKTLFTEHRQLIGTPEYMSPEQAEGSPDIDTRTDVYALGVLLYELLTGATPFDAYRLRSAAFAEMQRIIKEEEPPAPSVRVTQRLLGGPALCAGHAREPAANPGMDPAIASAADVESMSVPFAGDASAGYGHAAAMSARSADRTDSPASELKGELDWIVMKALDKDRARRYETPNQLAEDVRRHLTGEAVVAAPATMGYRARKFVRRHKGPVLAGSAVATALLIGIAGTTWQWRKADVLAHERLLEQERAAGQATSVTAYLLNLDIPWSMKPQPGGTMIIKSDPRRSIKFKRGKTPEETTVVAEDERHVEVPLSTAESLDALTYIASLALSGLDESTRQLKSSNDSLRERSDAAEWNAYTANIALAQAALAANNYPEARTILGNMADEKRGWEYRLLTLKVQSVNFVLNDGAVMDAAWTADGTRVVVTGWGLDRPRLFDAANGAMVGELRPTDLARLSGIAGPDGQTLRGSRETRWSAKSPDGRFEASRDQSFHDYTGNIAIWSVETQSLLARLSAPVSFELIQFSPAGDKLLVASDEREPHGIAVLPLASLGGPELTLKGDGIPLEIAAICEGQSCREGLTITDPSNTRRIVGSADKTVRFFDFVTNREVAVFRMPEAITNLKMTGDGTRLIVSLADETACVWDIREPAERREDMARRSSEREAAASYLETLMAGPIRREALRDTVVADPSLTALRRLVALEMLHHRLESLEADARR